MEESKLKVRTELRSEEELRKSKKGLYVLWIGAALMLTFLYFFMFLFGSGFGDNYVVIGFQVVFALFFTTVLGIIVYIQTRNGLAKEKEIYTGEVLDKKSEITRTANSKTNTSRETFSILVEDKWFVVDPTLFHTIRAHDVVELECIRNKNVIEHKILSRKMDENETETSFSSSYSDRPKARAQDSYRFESSTPILVRYAEGDKKTIRTAFFRAFFYRILLGAGFIIFLFFFLFMFIIIGFSSYVGVIHYAFYGLLILLLGIYILLNKRTVRLYRDLIANEKIESEDEVLDKIQSNSIKPSLNSSITTNFNVTGTVYYYVQAKNNWFPVTKEQYDALNPGDLVKVYTTQYTKLVLNVEMPNKVRSY